MAIAFFILGVFLLLVLMGVSASLKRLADHHEKFPAPEQPAQPEPAERGHTA